MTLARAHNRDNVPLNSADHDNFVYKVFCKMIGRGKPKTKTFGREELGDLDLVHGNVHGGHIATRQLQRKKYTHH